MPKKKFKVGKAALNRYAEKRQFSRLGLERMIKARKKGYR